MGASESREQASKALRIVEALARQCVESPVPLSKETLTAILSDIAAYAGRMSYETSAQPHIRTVT